MILKASSAVSLEEVRDWGYAKRLAWGHGYREDYFVQSGVSKYGRPLMQRQSVGAVVVESPRKGKRGKDAEDSEEEQQQKTSKSKRGRKQ